MIATLSKRGVLSKRVVGTQPNSIDPILSLNAQEFSILSS